MVAVPRPAVRRPISLTIVPLAAVASVVASIVAVPLLVMIDLVTRSGFRRTRLWCLVVGVLVTELSGTALAVAGLLWHLGRLDRDRTVARFHRLELWWVGRHARNFRRLAGVRWLVENPEQAAVGNAIVLARHASHADAVLPAILFGNMGGLRLRYTLKDDLQWAPAMDIVGNFLPNVFVDRSAGPDSPLEHRLEDLAHELGDHDVAVIFPEGTFFTPERLDRAASRLAETRPDLEASARSLGHLLPPRPAGTLALLRGAPEADVVLVAHEGMESFGDLRAIARNLPLDDPVRVRLWRIDRRDVPTEEDAFVTWLLERWIEMDQWIHTRVRERREIGTIPPLAGAQEIRT